MILGVTRFVKPAVAPVTLSRNMKDVVIEKKCEYTGKKCKLWDGECLAVDPVQCSYNSEEDVKAIKDWQKRIIREV
jgi:hypothetical protein